MILTDTQRSQCSQLKLRTKMGWRQLEMAASVLSDEYRCTARKTGGFCMNIQYPALTRRVCVDSHIFMCSLGIYDAGGTLAAADSAYSDCEQWVRELADEYGLSPDQFQAIVWIVRKRIMDGEPPPSWFDAWVECKYATHEKYNPKTGKMPDYTMDLDVWRMYASKDNLRWAYEQATPREWIDGCLWYERAHTEVKKVARKHGITMEQATHVVSALSPGRPWTDNIKSADSLITIVRGAS